MAGKWQESHMPRLEIQIMGAAAKWLYDPEPNDLSEKLSRFTYKYEEIHNTGMRLWVSDSERGLDNALDELMVSYVELAKPKLHRLAA